jgi:UDP-N-acetylglucosamine 3-dehydrogenase
MNTKTIHIGVIGVGSMGQNHLRIYSQMDRVKLVAIADTNPKLLQTLSDKYHVTAYADYKKMLESEKLDAVSIVVPTKYHYQVVLEVLKKNINALVEKPLAATVKECKKIISLLGNKKTILGVGHIERFNPVITTLKEHLDKKTLGRVFQIIIRRIGPYPQRIQDTGVMLDLATHDIDIMHYLLGAKIKNCSSQTSRLLQTKNEDLAINLLRFENGVVGLLIENWLSPTKIRDVTLNGEKGMFVADFLSQDLYFYENNFKPTNWYPMQVFRGVGEGNMIRYAIDKKEPLRVELESFIGSVLKKKQFLVTARDGLYAVQIAQELLQYAR